MATTSMRTVVIQAFGGPSNVKVVDATISAPQKEEVQVAIIYSGFNGADINMRNGSYPLQKKAPLNPGYCFVGRVRSNGAGCSKFKTGQLVTTITVYGSEAEFINIPEKYLIAVPDGVDLQQAVGLPVDWSTAYGMVMHTAKVSKGQRVFVHGLSGAVGHATSILCQMQGATVYGTASERNHAALRELGMIPYVYTNKDWIDVVKAAGGVHAVFDPLGFESIDESYAILTETEKSLLVCYGGNLSTLNGGKARSQIPMMADLFARNLKVFSKKRTAFYYITRDQKTFKPDVEHLLGMLKDGKIKVPVKCVYEMENIQDAHRSWASSSGMGCNLVRVAQEN